MFSCYHCGLVSLIHVARFMGPTWGPSGADRTQVGPMLAHEPCYLGTLYRSGPISNIGPGNGTLPAAPSHYLNQCWLIIRKVHWHSSERNFKRNMSAISHLRLACTNNLSKISFKFPRGQWLKLLTVSGSHLQLQVGYADTKHYDSIAPVNNGVSNHWQLDCWFNSLLRLTSRNCLALLTLGEMNPLPSNILQTTFPNTFPWMKIIVLAAG